MDCVLGADPKELYLIGRRLVGELWGWLIHTTFVFVMEMLMHICPYLSWPVAQRNLEVFSVLVRALSLQVICK